MPATPIPAQTLRKRAIRALIRHAAVLLHARFAACRYANTSSIRKFVCVRAHYSFFDENLPHILKLDAAQLQHFIVNVFNACMLLHKTQQLSSKMSAELRRITNHSKSCSAQARFQGSGRLP